MKKLLLGMFVMFLVALTAVFAADPILSAVGDKTVNEDSILTVDFSATDDDGDSLTYELTGLPADAILTDNGDGTATLSWTPDNDDVGVYDPVTISVSDGPNNAFEEFKVTVLAVNAAPVLTLTNCVITASVGDAYTCTVTASDEESGVLDPSLSSGAPSGMTLTDVTGVWTLSWTPDYKQIGSVLFTVTASDGILTDSETVTVIVSGSNAEKWLQKLYNLKVALNTFEDDLETFSDDVENSLDDYLDAKDDDDDDDMDDALDDLEDFKDDLNDGLSEELEDLEDDLEDLQDDWKDDDVEDDLEDEDYNENDAKDDLNDAEDDLVELLEDVKCLTYMIDNLAEDCSALEEEAVVEVTAEEVSSVAAAVEEVAVEEVEVVSVPTTTTETTTAAVATVASESDEESFGTSKAYVALLAAVTGLLFVVLVLMLAVLLRKK